MVRPVISEKDKVLLEKLRKLRNAKDLKPLPPNPFLKKSIVNLEGEEIPFSLRYYQIQGILNMLCVPKMVLGDGTGLGKCVSLDTRLLTDRGVRTMGSLRPPNAEVEGFYDLVEPTSIWNGQKMVPVKKFFWQGEVPTIRVKTRMGYVLEGSRVHPVLTKVRSGTHQHVKLQDLKIKNVVCLNRAAAPFPTQERFLKDGQPLTVGTAYILGWIQSTEVPRSDSEYLIEIKNLCRYTRAPFEWSPKLAIKHFSSNGAPEIKAPVRQIPQVILESPKEHVRAFLQTYFEFAGTIYHEGVQLLSASELLVRQVQTLLLAFGVPSKVNKDKRDIWKVVVFDDFVQAFLANVGFLSDERNTILRNTVKKSKRFHPDRLPNIDLAALEALMLRFKQKGELCKGLGSNDQERKQAVSGKVQPSRHLIKRVLTHAKKLGFEETPEYKTLEADFNYDYLYDVVVKIEEGSTEVADIEVDDPDHVFVGNGFINHNTIQTISTLCYLYEKNPKMRALVVAPKSAIRQWRSEVNKFTNGVETFLITSDLKKGKDESGVDARTNIYNAWKNHDGPAVLVINYALLVRDWNHGCYVPLKPNGKPDPKQPVVPGLLNKIFMDIGKDLTVVFDEATGFKSRKTKTWEVAQYLSAYASRVYALTATLLKNNLMEGYNILKAIRPTTFGNVTEFYEDYCFVEVKSQKGKRQIFIVKGYKNLDKFRDAIELVYLGRPKHLVSNELPTLITKEIRCELSAAEQAKYQEALNGILELGDGEVKDFEETKALTSIIYCQQVVNSLSLLKFDEGAVIPEWDDPNGGLKVGKLSAKEEALLDLLQEELEDEKIIVYTRFASHVPRLRSILDQAGIESVAITGAENDAKRKIAQDKFQDLKSNTKVVIITSAGSEAINLQAASGLVFFDAPWSWGEYVQVVGRMIRIGSPHKGVLCVHLLGELPGVGAERKTIDHHVLSLLRKKKNLIDKVLGEAAVGALTFTDGKVSMMELPKAMRSK